MKRGRSLLALLLVGVLAGVAYVSQVAEPAGSRMTRAAAAFVSSLTPAQRAKATFAFDDRERENWHFVPFQDRSKKPLRKGLALQDMSADQKQAALALLGTGTSAAGKQKAITIMSLEAILRELEKGAPVARNPEWYFFTVFGKPADNGRWGWRVEGHHLSLNFVVDRGQVVAATPAFFGANPATVQAGPRKGLRTLPEAEDLARELFKEFDEDQKKIAYQKEEFSEVQEESLRPKVGNPRGLPAVKMTPAQRTLLMQLLHAYTDRMPAEVAEVEMAQVKEGGVDNIHFAYAGGLEPGQPHTYRVQGPSFVVEFLNVQPDGANNPANHIHSVWRHLKGDFGITEQ